MPVRTHPSVSCADLGGSIPGWAMKMMAKDQPMVAGLVRDLVESSKVELVVVGGDGGW